MGPFSTYGIHQSMSEHDQHHERSIMDNIYPRYLVRKFDPKHLKRGKLIDHEARLQKKKVKTKGKVHGI